MLTEKQLLDLKQEISESKTKLTKLEGQQQYQMQQLKKQYKCDTVEEAEEKAGTMQKEIDKLKAKIKTATEELEEEYKELINEE